MTEFPQVTTEFTNPLHRFIIVSARGDVSKRNNQTDVDALTNYYMKNSIEYGVYRLDHVVHNG